MWRGMIPLKSSKEPSRMNGTHVYNDNLQLSIGLRVGAMGRHPRSMGVSSERNLGSKC